MASAAKTVDTMPSGLSARRKADRETIAAAMTVIAERHGAAVERRNEAVNPGYHGQGIALRLVLAGVGVMLDIDDLHERHNHPGTLIHWYNDAYPPKNFTSAFNAAVGYFSQHGPYHKATSSGSWSQVAEYLDAGLRLAAAGGAFREDL